MSATNILIILVALLGFLPLVVFLYKKRRYDRILAEGRTTRGYIYDKWTNTKRTYEIVYYSFTGPDGREYRGQLTTSPGAYRRTDGIEVYYLPANPAHNTVKGKGGYIGFLLFMIAIAVAVLYMMYRLYRQVNEGGEW